MKRERKSRRVAGGDNTYVLCVPHIVHDRPVGSFRNVHAAQLHCDSCDCELDHNDGIIGKDFLSTFAKHLVLSSD